ncbi:MAG TPA: hypothetical protein DIT01_11275 [Lentisphaeria bacterium]|jgi:SAM-dependent methyltransferase|nr:hypothetical protein [Lentisphaeria bacterium]
MDRCLLCNKEVPVRFTHADRRFMVCGDCNFGFYDRDVAADVAAHFTTFQYDHDPDEILRHSGWKRAIEDIRALKPDGVFVDIGCQFGEFLRALAPYPYERVGLEISTACIEYLKANNLADTIYDRDLLALDVADESWDIVTMWNVLDLLLQPLETLQRLQRILKPDGLLVIRLPNLSFHLPVKKLCNTLHIRDPSVLHDTMYSVRSLRLILERCGYQVIRIGPSPLSDRDPSQFGHQRLHIRAGKAAMQILGWFTSIASGGRSTVHPSIIAYARKP